MAVIDQMQYSRLVQIMARKVVRRKYRGYGWQGAGIVIFVVGFDCKYTGRRFLYKKDVGQYRQT